MCDNDNGTRQVLLPLSDSLAHAAHDFDKCKLTAKPER